MIERNSFSDEFIFKSELKKRKTHIFYSEDMQSSYLQSEEEYWMKTVDSVKFDFLTNKKSLSLQKELNIYYKTFLRFQEAIDSYMEDKDDHKHISDISIKSAKNFLYLLPTIDSYLPNINIDADTGYVNITFTTNDNGVLSALVTGKAEIHYSRISKGVKIFKISGVAKIKDSRDFNKFAKVLEML